MIDTGAAAIIVPEKHLNQIIDAMNAKLDSSHQIKCHEQEGGLCIYGSEQPCSNFEHLDHLTFEFENTKFNISPKAYLADDPDLGLCILLMMPGISHIMTGDEYLIGEAFLRHFYQVYDYENQMVKFAVNIHSQDYVSIGELNSNNILHYYLLGIGIAVVVILTSIITYRCCKNKTKKREVQVVQRDSTEQNEPKMSKIAKQSI